MSRILLESGNTFGFTPASRREMELVGSGRSAYLWIGNASEPHFCYATLSGAVTLRKFAQQILDTVPAPKRKAKKR